MKKHWFYGIFLVICSGMLSISALGADQEDYYVEADLGFRLRQDTAVHTGLNFGYVVSDGLGIGLFAGQFQSSPSSTEVWGWRTGLEVRMFLEPWEFYAGLGWMGEELRDSLGSMRHQAVVTLGSVYLFAITPSLALKLEGRFDPPISGDQQGAIQVLTGGRLLF